LQSNKSLFDFVEFFCFTYKLYALLRFIVIDMPKNEVRIYNSKAVIYQNDYDVWQFRMWLADEDKYIRQSLRTKDKAKAIADAEALYEDIKYMYKPNAKSKAKKVKSFPSTTPPPIPKSKNLPTSNAVSSTSTSANDIQNVRNDFMAKQQASQPIKPQGSVGTL